YPRWRTARTARAPALAHRTPVRRRAAFHARAATASLPAPVRWRMGLWLPRQPLIEVQVLIEIELLRVGIQRQFGIAGCRGLLLRRVRSFLLRFEPHH